MDCVTIFVILQKFKNGDKNMVDDKRFSVRMTEDQFDKLSYWAEKEEISRNAFVVEAINHYIGFLNNDYDVPNALVERVNQLVDVISMLASNQESLESVVINGFDSIMGISRGSNYLLDEKGDL